MSVTREEDADQRTVIRMTRVQVPRDEVTRDVHLPDGESQVPHPAKKEAAGGWLTQQKQKQNKGGRGGRETREGRSIHPAVPVCCVAVVVLRRVVYPSSGGESAPPRRSASLLLDTHTHTKGG